jgi:mannose/fructose-specific phosphotransferase system component IIA
MSESVGRVRGVVVGHGGMATGMVDAVRRIAGVGEEVLIPLSNEGKGPDALRTELDRLIGCDRVIVFTDMHAGSCAVAARMACREQAGAAPGAGRAVVCGVNLPMLLDFVFNRELPLDQLVPRLVEQGRAAVSAHLPNADPAVSR